jgi:hypothetical protein
MLVYKLRVTIAAKKNAEIVKPGNDALELDPIDQKDGHWCFLLSDVVEKNILKVLGFL